MTSSFHFIRRHIQEMPPYQPILPYEALSTELGLPAGELVKLDGNENPYGACPGVAAALARMQNLHIYPDPECRRIRRRLAEHHHIAEESIVVSAGADELIDLILRVTVEPDEGVINCPPTFGMYAFDGLLNRAQLVNVPRKPDFSVDVEGIEQAVARQPAKVLFLANPNNPDGSMAATGQIERLLHLPLLVVVDEAYIHFSEPGASMLEQAQRYPNLVVLRTFSKWAGLAGLRIGYGVFPRELAAAMMKAKQPYNVSAAAEQAALASMDALDVLEDRCRRILDQRGKLYSELESLPWLQPYPSQANFVLYRVWGRPAGEVSQALRRRGILVRYFDKPGLQDCIRISIGTPEQMRRLVNALKEMEG
jgi:histidinol-phosphate aminotransferase